MTLTCRRMAQSAFGPLCFIFDAEISAFSDFHASAFFKISAANARRCLHFVRQFAAGYTNLQDTALQLKEETE